MPVSEDQLGFATVLKGFSDGIMKGLEMRMKYAQQDKENEFQQKKLDFEEQRVLKEDKVNAEKQKRQAIIDESELLSKGLRVNSMGSLEEIPEDELPDFQKQVRKQQKLKTKGDELEIKKTSAEIKKLEAETEKALNEAKKLPAAGDYKEFQLKAASFARRAELAEEQLADLYKSDPTFKPEDKSTTLFTGKVKVPFAGNEIGAPEFLKPQDIKKSESIQSSWIQSVLRDESGAAIPESELDNYKKTYFPQPGDEKEVIENKRVLRAQAVQSLKARAGDAIKLFPKMTAGGKIKQKEQIGAEDPRLQVLQDSLATEKDPAKKQRIQLGIQELTKANSGK